MRQFEGAEESKHYVLCLIVIRFTVASASMGNNSAHLEVKIKAVDLNFWKCCTFTLTEVSPDQKTVSSEEDPTPDI